MKRNRWRLCVREKEREGARVCACVQGKCKRADVGQGRGVADSHPDMHRRMGWLVSLEFDAPPGQTAVISRLAEWTVLSIERFLLHRQSWRGALGEKQPKSLTDMRPMAGCVRTAG